MAVNQLTRRGAVALAAAMLLLSGVVPAVPPGTAVAVVLASPTLTSPSSGDTVTGNPVFAWTAVSGAAKYRIEISASATFSPTVVAEDTETLRYTPISELPLGQLYWRVAAKDAANTLGTYASDVFTKEWGVSPNPLTPSDGATLTFPTDALLFTWEALPGAQSYELQIDDASDFVGATSYATKNLAYVVTEPRTVGQEFFWRVRGVSGGLYSDWSPARTFTSEWPTAPTLVHPADGASTTDVYFDWDPVPGAKTYQLQVSPNGDWANNKTIDVTVKSTRYAPPTTTNNGNYFWRVRAMDAASTQNYGPWSEVRVFEREWPGRPTLLAPADGDTIVPVPTFSWTPVDHASWYRLQLSTDVNFGSGLFGCITNRTTYTPYGLYNDGATGVGLVQPGGCGTINPTPGTTYYWRVQALDAPVVNPGVDIYEPPAQGTDGVIGLWSATRSFQHDPPAALPPDPAYPGYIDADDYLTPARCLPGVCTAYEADTPVLTWNAVPGAAYYTVYVALDPNFTNVYRVYTTTFTRLAPRNSWRDNQANQAYYWFVRPNVADDPTNPTGKFDETVFPLAGVFQKRSEGIHRSAPLEGAHLANDFTFEWDDYLDTNQALSSPVDQEAKQYQIEVSTAADFTASTDEKVVDQPFFTPYDRTYPEGPIYWRVQAIDGSNNDLTLSSVGSLVKESPAVALSWPTDGSTVLGVPTLQWDPQDHAASYDVQVDNDANFSSPITTVTTKMCAWTYAEALAAGSYYWRVRRNDADNRDGPWSDVWSFVLQPDAPTLLSPTEGANPNPSTLVLQWTAAQPTPKYTVEVSTSLAFSSFAGNSPKTTVMSQWAPTKLLTNGTYYWRVKALNFSGGVLAISGIRSFTVDSTRPGASISPASAAPITASFTATFSEPVTGVSGATFVVTVAGTSTALPGTVTVLSPTQARFTPASLLVPGQTYTISLSTAITDLVGNPLLFSAVNVRTSTTVQNDSPAIRETWGRWSTSSASGGAMKMSRTGSTKLTFTFTGTDVAFIGYQGPSGGYASVYLDGALQTSSLSFYSSSSRYKRTLWSKAGLAVGQHRLEIVPRGTKPSASKGTWVYVDAFTVGGVTAQENAATVVDRFRRISSSSASGGSYDRTSHVKATGRSGASLTLQFKGTGVSWYGTKGTSSGKAYVYIDSVYKGSVDLYYSSTRYKQRIWTSATLTNGVHTLKILVYGTRRTGATGYDVSFDYFTVK